MADATIKQSGGDFTSINAFIGDGATSGGDTGTISGTWSADDTTSVTWNKAVIIVATGSSKQSGRPWRSGDTTYRHRVTSGHAFTVTAVVDITDINIQSDSAGVSDELFRMDSASNITIKKCQLGFTGNTDQQEVVYVAAKTGFTVVFEQCFFYDVGRDIYGEMTGTSSGTSAVHFNSCSSFNIGADGARGNGCWVGHDIGYSTHTLTVNAHNCLFSVDDVNVFAGIGAAPTFNVSATYCISSTTSANLSANEDSETTTGTGFSYTWTEAADPGSGSKVGMLDITGPDYDPALTDHANNDAIAFHATVSGSGLTIPATDIIGQSRDITTPLFDVGPYARTLEAAAAPFLPYYDKRPDVLLRM